MNKDTLRALVLRNKDRLTRGTLVRFPGEGHLSNRTPTPRYCILGAALHEAGLSDEELRIARNMCADVLWETYGSQLTTCGVESEEEAEELIQVNDEEHRYTDDDVDSPVSDLLTFLTEENH